MRIKRERMRIKVVSFGAVKQVRKTQDPYRNNSNSSNKRVCCFIY